MTACPDVELHGSVIFVRHDMLGFYLCWPEEGQHEDEGNPSVGFDGRRHFASIEAAEAEAERLGLEVEDEEGF